MALVTVPPDATVSVPARLSPRKTTAGGTPASGLYRIFTYGTLAGAVSNFSTTVTGANAGSAELYAAGNGINVRVFGADRITQYWAGAQGGAGTWNATNTNWADDPAAGTVNDRWRSQAGVFGTGTPNNAAVARTVTVEGAQSVQSLRFSDNLYTLTAGAGGSLNLVGNPFAAAADRAFGSVTVDPGNTASINLPITGTAGLLKLGAGTLNLGGANTYAGGTRIDAGTLAILAGASVAATVANNAGFTNAGTVNGGVVNAATGANSGTITGRVSNAATFTNSGTLSGGLTNTTGTYTQTAGATNGGTTNAATIVANGGAFTGAIANNAGAFTVGGAVSASSTFANAGTATLAVAAGSLTGITVLTNDSTAAAGVATAAGTTLAAGGLAGTTAGATLANAGTLALGGGVGDTAYAGRITGAGAVTKAGSGVQTLTGANAAGAQYTGAAAVNGGTLRIEGTFGDTAANAATLTVGAAGTLTGSGTVAGSVVSNGTVAAGTGGAVGTLRIGGNYTIAAGSTARFDLGAPGAVGGPANDLVTVGGNLSIDDASTLALQTVAGGRIASGSYTLFEVAGTTGAGRFGTVTNGGANATADVTQIVTNGGTAPSRYDVLLAGNGQRVQFWDGANLSANGVVNGGAGTWNATSTNWTTVDGATNDQWRSQAGVFAGAAGGAVTVSGTQGVQALQFRTSGYALSGGALALVADSGLSGSTAASITVDSGVAASIASPLQGVAGLTKFGSGTLTLSGASTYTGATTITGGTLRAGAANAFSAASAVTIASGARMDLNGLDQSVASLAGAGSVTLGSATLTTGGGNASTTYAGTLSGTGGLTKAGTGTLTLSGTNSFTGPTTVQAGTLVNTGGLAGSVSNAATFTNAGSVGGGLTNTGTVTAAAGRIDGTIANNAGTVAVTGQVSSNGTFTNAGGATLAVTGTGIYSLAGLLTNAGSLTVAPGGSLTAPAGIVNSGSIAVAQGGTITDALANSGSVANDGAYNADIGNTASGTIANRATGVWTGTLTANTGGVTNAGQWRGDGRNEASGRVSNTGTWTTATGPFANAGTLVTSGVVDGGVANTGTVLASGRIAGAVSNGTGARFTVAGPLTGVTTFVNDGTLDLGGTTFAIGALSGTSTTAVLRNGTLATNGDDSATVYAGSIVDGAVATSLVKNGSGSLTLTGTNTSTGGITINGGTLIASAAGLGSGPVTANSDLIVDQAGDATLGSALAGTSRFTKQGAGTLTTTGTGTLSGPTTVAAGGLVVNGSLAASPVTVTNGASLGGGGRIGGLTVQAGAMVSPGAGTAAGNLGTLSVNGNVLFANRSLYQVDATAAGQSDRIAATGTATLQGGTVQVTAGTGAYAPRTRYTILSAAGGVTGRFAGVTANFAFLTPSLSYDANDAYLTLGRNDLRFRAAAATRNQGGVAAAAQALGAGSRLHDGIAVLSAAQARQAFDALSGEIHAGAVTSQFATGSLVREAILDRLRFGDAPSFGGRGAEGIGQRFAPGTTLPSVDSADLPGRAPAVSPVTAQLAAPSPVAAWGQAFGAFGAFGGDGNAARLDQQTSGFVLGAETRFDENWRIGVAGGYTFTTLDVTARHSSGTVESGYGALYAGGSLGPIQLRLGGAYAGSSLATSRAVLFPGFSENASARYGGSLGQLFGEVGYRIGSGTGYVEPFLGGAAIRLGRDGFTERGGAAALTGRRQDDDIATATVGVQAQGQIGALLGSATPIFVRGRVGYRRAYGDVVPSTLSRFGATGQTFLTAGVPVARDAMVAQAGLDWQVAPTATLSIAYTGQVGADRTQVHGVKGGFLYRW
ncbi:autotransporter domain-containing protein [Methylobacterium oryzisoli]|uniref:autotransporter domain-containing protein n=1 Tax=Methylobacterium oryzisoli TaxID=3385502 RepID=UPI0038925E2A